MIFRLRSILAKLLTLLSIFTFIFFMTSCGGEEPTDEMIEEVETFVDDANAEITAADTSSTGVYQEEVSDEEVSLQDAMKNNNTEPEIEEGAMSFCECVKENQRLDKIIMGDETSDADFDKAMADKTALKDGDCKILFPDQSTIDEKRAHERKVKRCL